MPKPKKSTIVIKELISDENPDRNYHFRPQTAPPTLAELRKLLRSNPELASMAPHVAGGIKAVEYAFSVLDAAETIEAPHGIELSAIEIRAKNTTSEKAVGEVTCANWIIEIIKQQIGHKDEEAKVKVS
jgi:hypothetical protein